MKQSVSSRITQSQSDIEKIRYDFGYQLMGPVITEYLMKLHSYIEHFDQVRDAKIVFVSRAGIRIRRALETYLNTIEARLPEDVSNFWVSRLMVAKGTWKRNRENSIATLSSEFYHAPIRDLVDAMYRFDGLPDGFPIKHGGLDRQGKELGVFFNNRGPAAQALAAHFDEQADLFESYLKNLLGGRSRVLLIDTGWAGTAQRMLADAYPEIDWWGAYFGRYGFAHTDRKYWRNMLGLVFEQDDYEFQKPETCTILHRHMIEDIFEPSGSSVERLIQTEDGKIEAPEAKAILADNPDRESDPIFVGILDYLSELPGGTSPTVLHKKSRTAWWEISRIISMPTLDETAIFSDISRSADFGKTLEVPLLLPSESRHDGDTPEGRISAALWQTGQVALEYPREIADPLQRKLAGLGRFDFKKNGGKVPHITITKRKRPSVAIVTRTLDRPMFLRRALESVANQTFVDYVQVVVNDGGDNEDAKRTIENANCAHHKVMLVDNVVNRGMEAASNIGIDSVDSDYIIIHDDDDSWEPTFLEKAVTFLDGPNCRTYGGVITRSTYVSEEITAKGIKIHGTSAYQGWVENVHIMEMAIGNFFPPIAFLFRRDIYDKVGGFNEDYPVLGDWDFNLRFLLETDIGMIHEALANYHHRDKGDVNLFGNSVIAGRDKHLEYSAVVRNRFARNLLHTDHPALAVMVGVGLHFDANRSAIRDIQNKAGSIMHPPSNIKNDHRSESDTPNGDDYWVAMDRFSKAVARNDKGVLRKVGGGFLCSWSPLLKGRKKFISNSIKLSWSDINYLTNMNKDGYDLNSPPDFDEGRYLIMNPDVAKAVTAGHFSSGYEHFFRFGRQEGRARPTLNVG